MSAQPNRRRPSVQVRSWKGQDWSQSLHTNGYASSRLRRAVSPILVQLDRAEAPARFVQVRVHQPVLAHSYLDTLRRDNVAQDYIVHLAAGRRIDNDDSSRRLRSVDHCQDDQMRVEVLVQRRLAADGSTERRDRAISDWRRGRQDVAVDERDRPDLGALEFGAVARGQDVA